METTVTRTSILVKSKPPKVPVLSAEVEQYVTCTFPDYLYKSYTKKCKSFVHVLSVSNHAHLLRIAGMFVAVGIVPDVGNLRSEAYSIAVNTMLPELKTYGPWDEVWFAQLRQSEGSMSKLFDVWNEKMNRLGMLYSYFLQMNQVQTKKKSIPIPIRVRAATEMGTLTASVPVPNTVDWDDNDVFAGGSLSKDHSLIVPFD